MIRLLKNATIGGRIRRAGEIVSDISGEMANTFVEAGAAEWPGEAKSAEQRTESPEEGAEGIALEDLTNAELNERAEVLGLNTKRLKRDDKLKAIAEAEAEKAADENDDQQQGQAPQGQPFGRPSKPQD